VAGDVGLRIDEISGNLNKLITMHSQVQRMRDRVADMRALQTSDVWPAIDSVVQFADQYRGALNEAETVIRQIETEIEECRLALAESARSLQNQDAAVEERLRALADRLEATAQVTTSARYAARAV
jgi:methyl-accepting chemotaxis protein